MIISYSKSEIAKWWFSVGDSQKRNIFSTIYIFLNKTSQCSLFHLHYRNTYIFCHILIVTLQWETCEKIKMHK